MTSIENGFLSRVFGLNKTILFTIISRGVQALGGVGSIFLVLHFLSKDEQGYYYTFLSLLSIQIFFELGLSNIIVQYVAHEFAHASDDNFSIKDPSKLSKLSSLLHFFTRWYLIVAMVLFVGLVIAGFVFFSSFNNGLGISWKMPWIILSFSASIMFLITFFLAFIEGMGRIKEVAKIKMIQQILSICLTCILLISGAKLYTSAISTSIVALVLVVLTFSRERVQLLKSIWKVDKRVSINYKKEIFPLQWRIAISWVGGYLIFQMFNPVLFAFAGAKAAGQMGATLSVLNGIIALSLSWISTKVAIWARYISLGQIKELDSSFNTTLIQSTLINALGIFAFYFGLMFLGYFFPNIKDRFISNTLLILFSSTFLINHIINCWATYLRCFKKEPFLIQAVIVGALCGFSTYFLGRYFGIDGLIWGYFSITVCVSLPLSYYLFRKYRILYSQLQINVSKQVN